MHVLAKELNETLQGTIVDAMLSDVGRRMFFPKGIVAQSAEAGKKATRFNATIGMATSGGQPMYLSDIYHQFTENSFKPSELFSYAPVVEIPPSGHCGKSKCWSKTQVFKERPSAFRLLPQD